MFVEQGQGFCITVPAAFRGMKANGAEFVGKWEAKSNIS